MYPHLAKDVDVNDMPVHICNTHIILIYRMPRMTQYKHLTRFIYNIMTDLYTVAGCIV